MSLQDYKIPTTRVVNWMNAIRSTSEEAERYTLLECFWESQLKSKIWLITELLKITDTLIGTSYVFGGWHGLNAMFICDNFPLIQKIYSIDLDPKCVSMGLSLTGLDTRIIFQTQPMETFVDYESDTCLVINTATEHISQDVFDKWYNNIPPNCLLVLQGNNYIDLVDQHIRPNNTIQEFLETNRIDKLLFSGELDCAQFTRYMSIGYKL